MNKPLLILMARWPAPGRCKKRLAADIGLTKASEIQKRLLVHTISVARALEREGALEIHLAIAGLASKAIKRLSINQKIKSYSGQGDGGLGTKMRRQIIRAQYKNRARKSIGRTVILIGTDLPSICKYDLQKAIEYLKANDLVIGPAKDGGYWLLGLSGRMINPVAHWPFSGINWGSNKVLNQTILKAKEEGVDPLLLNRHNDLDQLNDLSPWQSVTGL